MTRNSTSRPGNLMNVKAYEAKAAMRIGMNVAGSAMAKLLMRALPSPGLPIGSWWCESVNEPQLAGLSAVHQPVVFASLSLRKEVINVPNAGTIQKKQMMTMTSLTDQCARFSSSVPPTAALRRRSREGALSVATGPGCTVLVIGLPPAAGTDGPGRS